MDVWEKLRGARVAVMATIKPDGGPHVVPIVFAVIGERIVTAVDGKPKSTSRLRRLANLDANPSVSLLVHHYEEDWSGLWWIRIDGRATVVAADPEAIEALRRRYRQYETVDLVGPVISIEITAMRSWPG